MMLNSQQQTLLMPIYLSISSSLSQYITNLEKWYLFTGVSRRNPAGPRSCPFMVQGTLPPGPGRYHPWQGHPFLLVRYRLPPWPGPPAGERILRMLAGGEKSGQVSRNMKI
jgi:hypothetical protein